MRGARTGATVSPKAKKQVRFWSLPPGGRRLGQGGGTHRPPAVGQPLSSPPVQLCPREEPVPAEPVRQMPGDPLQRRLPGTIFRRQRVLPHRPAPPLLVRQPVRPVSPEGPGSPAV